MAIQVLEIQSEGSHLSPVAQLSVASPSLSMVKRHVKGGKAMKKFGGPKTKSQPWKVKSSIQKATAKAEAAPKPDVKMAPVKTEKAPKAPKPSKKDRRKQRAAHPVAAKPVEKSPKASPKAKAASPVMSKASPPGSPTMKPEMEVDVEKSKKQRRKEQRRTIQVKKTQMKQKGNY
ncbi:unnamed protein product [Cladocopium goreaui]|uniref:Uncharacterized protein n=1 Tax=Cladocopium goreaui TaxID=2562237 RepID=A0A9P1GPL9_9DINO|nr:unnamed protein product [Cladocopium goreaui]